MACGLERRLPHTWVWAYVLNAVALSACSRDCSSVSFTGSISLVGPVLCLKLPASSTAWVWQDVLISWRLSLRQTSVSSCNLVCRANIHSHSSWLVSSFSYNTQPWVVPGKVGRVLHRVPVHFPHQTPATCTIMVSLFTKPHSRVSTFKMYSILLL